MPEKKFEINEMANVVQVTEINSIILAYSAHQFSRVNVVVFVLIIILSFSFLLHSSTTPYPSLSDPTLNAFWLSFIVSAC